MKVQINKSDEGSREVPQLLRKIGRFIDNMLMLQFMAPVFSIIKPYSKQINEILASSDYYKWDDKTLIDAIINCKQPTDNGTNYLGINHEIVSQLIATMIQEFNVMNLTQHTNIQSDNDILITSIDNLINLLEQSGYVEWADYLREYTGRYEKLQENSIGKELSQIKLTLTNKSIGNKNVSILGSYLEDLEHLMENIQDLYRHQSKYPPY